MKPSMEPATTPGSGMRRRVRTPATRRALPLLFALSAWAAGCASDAAPPADPADYRRELSAVCQASNAERAALAEPADAVGVTAFAQAVSDVLTRQAEAARALLPPDELDDDHRAFVQNTADQAARWSTLAATSPDDAEQFGAVQTEILELTLGRDDLVDTMQIPECRIVAD